MAFDGLTSTKSELDALLLSLGALNQKVDGLAARVTKLETTPGPGPDPEPEPEPEPEPATKRYFSAQSNWNTPISASPSLSPRSQDLVNRLVSLKPGTNTLQLNQNTWAVNVAVAPKGFTGRRVSAINPGNWKMDGIPLLETANGTPDTDAHLVIIDEDQNKVWNFQGNTKRTANGYTAEAMGVFRLDGPGWYNPNMAGPWTGRSSNASLLGGLIFPEELRAGAIEHALAIGIDGSQMAPLSEAARPAYTSDGGGVPGGIPNGTRYQLNPSFNVEASTLGKEAKVIAKAMQKYGFFVTERTSGIALYFRSTSNGLASYAGMNFSGLNGNLLSQCRVIAPALSYEYDFPARFTPAQPYR